MFVFLFHLALYLVSIAFIFCSPRLRLRNLVRLLLLLPLLPPAVVAVSQIPFCVMLVCCFHLIIVDLLLLRPHLTFNVFVMCRSHLFSIVSISHCGSEPRNCEIVIYRLYAMVIYILQLSIIGIIVIVIVSEIGSSDFPFAIDFMPAEQGER